MQGKELFILANLLRRMPFLTHSSAFIQTLDWHKKTVDCSPCICPQWLDWLSWPTVTSLYFCVLVWSIFLTPCFMIMSLLSPQSCFYITSIQFPPGCQIVCSCTSYTAFQDFHGCTNILLADDQIVSLMPEVSISFGACCFCLWTFL